MNSDEVQRRLSAILSADAVGYSRLMAADEVSTVRMLEAHRDEIRARVAAHGGRVVDAPGDNLLAEFPSATEATRCALEIQQALGERNRALPEERRLPFRIGLHLGEVMVEGERIYGDGINVAARLEGRADPGGICISGAVLEQLRNKLELEYDDLGAVSLKNVPAPVHAYRVRMEGQSQPAASRSLRNSRPLALAMAGALVLGGALVAWRWLGPIRSAPPATIRSLAVLPLANLSGDPDQEYFADGMTEALIADLAKVESLRVISRTSIMRFKGTSQPLPEIARELGVDAVVEGAVVRVGDEVRITAQLIDARSDHHLWSESYARGLNDVLALQSDVARSVARAIQLELTPRERERPVDPRAYEAYLRGRFFATQFGAENHQRAVKYFEAALGYEPSYAAAYAGLADAFT